MCCGPGREYWDCSCAVRESSRMRRGGILLGDRRTGGGEIETGQLLVDIAWRGVRNWAKILELLAVAEVPSLLLIVHMEVYICKTLYHMYRRIETNKQLRRFGFYGPPPVIKASTGAI